MERVNSVVLPLGNVGLATDMPQQDRQLTHYRTNENVMYEQSGAVRKCGGDSRINATAIASDPTITGMFDFWRAGTSGTFTQKFVVMTSNSKIYKEDMDGTFDDITGSATITSSAIPVFCQARDTLLIFTNTNDTPLKWDQSGDVATLGGSPPAGRGAVFHLNRVWIWSANDNPSRITYGSSTDIEDYTGADTGFIDIDPDDGDRIVGCAVYKKKLIVFKGPNKGSIHVISGTAPTGSDAFARTPLTRGIALQSHHSIISVNDDIWFWSNRGVHSLAATDQFGDYAGAFLTRFLHSFFRTQVNRAGFGRVQGVSYDEKGTALWVYPGSGSATNNRTFGLSYLNAETGLKAFTWTRGGASACIRINPSSMQHEIAFGGVSNGYVTLQDQPAREIAPNTAYSMRQVTPHLLFAEHDAAGRPRPYGVGTIVRLGLRSVSTGNWDVHVTMQRDSVESTGHTFNQGALLTTTGGFILGTSRLGFDTFGGGSAGGPQLQWSKADGQARSVQFTITQGGWLEDAHLQELVFDWKPEAFQEAELN